MDSLSITTTTMDLMSIFCNKELIDKVIDDFKNHFSARILNGTSDNRLLDECLSFEPNQDYYNYWEVTEYLTLDTIPLMEKCEVFMSFIFCDGNMMYKDNFCCCRDQALLVHTLYKYGFINGNQHYDLIHPYNEYSKLHIW